MFLNFIRDFALKKIISKSLSNYKPVSGTDAVYTVGILIDDSYFPDKDAFISQLLQNGINSSDIETLSFMERVKSKEVVDYPYFTRKNISTMGTFEKPEAAAFLNKPFDMLISYYDVEKAPLMLATLQSKAKFKVGFSTVDKRLNHFMIDTVAEKQTEFITELFKYLKILKKI
ncbi:MAG: hypothetical protein EOO45_29320 [Flavobacterium sp.]|nr:MAG: hypothetical protein EOO45_29320 [Flavobacterium sp.]